MIWVVAGGFVALAVIGGYRYGVVSARLDLIEREMTQWWTSYVQLRDGEDVRLMQAVRDETDEE